MSDMLADLRAVLDSQEYRAAKEFADKYLVDGALLVTPAQHAAIRRAAAATDDRLRRWWDPSYSPSPLVDIPVVVVKDDGLAHPIGNGRYAVVTDNGIYVFTPEPWAVIAMPVANQTWEDRNV
ncbi:hypothetical protein [Mycolicibacterium mageritense]|uniref:hypothetical protein n=1 Tax=Mycolicibacterium mageritense TaxID=53462 RepID=UPI001E649930|nr:hypothetical protein [Mycolicibacterium mageritense]MCC9181151.1 hypothetical protein [Mycolicibacterium mageritense]